MQMINIPTFLTNYILIPFLGLFLFYCFGRPRWAIRLINKVWGLTLTKYEFSVFTFLSMFFFCGSFYNYIDRMSKLGHLNEILENRTNNEYSQKLEHQKKMVFRCERGMYLYFCFFLLTIVCVKLADVYEKKFVLEENLEKQEDILKKQQKQKTN